MANEEQAAEPTSRVIIAKRGDVDPVALDMSGLVVGWEVNRAGQFSGFAPADQLNSAGLDADNLTGYWIRYEHPTAGVWAGVCTLANYADGVVEIGGQGFGILTKKRLVDISEKNQEPYVGTPSSILNKAFTQIANSGPLFITRGTIDESEEQVEVTFNAADFYDEVIGQITDDIDREWKVNEDRVLTYAKRIGNDLTSSVKLVEGRAILVGSGYADDIFTVVNRLRATGFGRIKKKSRKGRKLIAEFNIGPITVTNQESIDKFGVLEESRDYGYVGTEAELRRRALAEVEFMENPEASITLQLADVDGAYESFREGDSVTIEIGLSGIRAEMRVMVRSLDVTQGVMTISGTGIRV